MLTLPPATDMLWPVVTGHEAIVRALQAARIKRVWSFPGSPLTRTELLLDKTSALSHRTAVNEHVAVSALLGGALLSAQPSCALVRHVGVNVALDALATFGVLNELRSAAVIIEGTDSGPRTSQNAQDNRAALARMAHLVQLEAATPDELYHLTRLAARLSARTGMPVALRAGAPALDAKAELNELPPELPTTGAPSFARAAGPFICTAATYRFHVDKRARLLAQLTPFVEALVLQSPAGDAEAALGVIVAGHLGAAVQARAWARRVPVLRLGAAWPLPRQALIGFLRDKKQVLVLEEGEPFLETEVAALAQREGLAARVRGPSGARPLHLDDERIEALLGRFGGRVRAESDPTPREPGGWRALGELVDAIGHDDAEPWPLHVARLRGDMRSFSPSDPRLSLLRALRGLDRPTMIVSDPGNTGVLGIRDRLIDVKMHMGSAAPVAGALAEAHDVEERAGAGVPLAVALIGDTNLYHSEWNGIIDNAIARREVLHVLVVNRRPDAASWVKTPYLVDEALEASLRAIGLQVATCKLDDPGLGAAVAYAASRSGPRALVCYATGGSPSGEDSDG